MPRTSSLFTIAVSLAALAASHVGAQGPRAPVVLDSAEVAAFADSLFAREIGMGIPGAVVAVVSGGRTIFAKGYGVVDLERRAPVDPHRTVFRVASVSKPVTALAVMQLVEQGRVRTSDPVERHLGGVRLPPSPGRPITVHDLLTHTAGLDVRVNGTTAASDAEVVPLGDYLAASLPPRVRPAGEVLAYSNHGYTLLGQVVETASGMPFDRYMQERVLAPLGMTASSFRLTGDVAARAATGYEPQRGGGWRRSAVLHPNIGPAAGLNATAADMARLMIALLGDGGGVLGPATLAELRATHFTPHPRMPGIAYGLFESVENGRRALFHVGGLRGFISGMYLWPDEGVGLFVSTNGYSVGLVRDAAYAFLDRFLPGATATPRVETSTAVARYAGRYRLAGQSRRTLEKAGGLRGMGELAIADHGDGTLGIWGVRFAPVGPGWFRDVAGDETLGFTADADGRVLRVSTTDLFAATQVWERLPWWETADAHRSFLIAAILVFLAALLAPPRWPLPRRLLGAAEAPPPPSVWARRAVRGACALYLLFLVLAAIAFRASAATGMLVRVPPLLDAAVLVATAGACVALTLPAFAGLALARRWWTPASRAHFAFTTAFALAFVAFLHYWNLLGIRH